MKSCRAQRSQLYKIGSIVTNRQSSRRKTTSLMPKRGKARFHSIDQKLIGARRRRLDKPCERLVVVRFAPKDCGDNLAISIARLHAEPVMNGVRYPLSTAPQQ